MTRMNMFGKLMIVAMVAITCVAAAEAGQVTTAVVGEGRTASNGGLGTIDLTVGDTALDWVKSSGTDLYYAEKANTDLLTVTSTGSLDSYGDDGYYMSWTGGDASAAGGESGSSYAGSRGSFATADDGFTVTFTAPEAGTYVITLYSALICDDEISLTATDDSGNTSTITATVFSASDYVDEATWTVTWVADSADDVLTIDLLQGATPAGDAYRIVALTGVTVTGTTVPEPASMCLLGLGGIAALIRRRRNA